MSKAERPWMKFYPADWRSDPALRMCSYAARGLWVDMLSLMHEADPYGHLVISGKAPSSKQLAGLLGGTFREIDRLLQELERAGVFSRNEDGIIFSRRMLRDRSKLERNRENGGLGGNPHLKAQDNQQDKPSDNGLDNHEDKGGLKAHMLDARTQTSERETGSNSETLPDTPRIPYRWRGKIIRLNSADYDGWRKAYASIPDLDAELTRIDDSLAAEGKSKGWFPAASAMLSAKHQRNLERQREAAKPGPRFEASPDIVPGSDLTVPESWGDG